MEDRLTAGLHLELGDLDPAHYERTRVPLLLARPAVTRVSWWETVVPGRDEFPRAVPEGTLLGVAETDGSPLGLAPLPGTTARTFSRYPRPSQGILTGRPTTGLLVVWISPSSDDRAQPLRDWSDFIHISKIAAAGIPGYTQITPYENTETSDPRFMHFYEMDSDDPEATFQTMAETLRRRLGGYRDPAFIEWADAAAAGADIIYVNTFRLLGSAADPEFVGARSRLTSSAAMAFVLVEKPRPHVTLITLNRPERMNAMAFDVMIPLREALEQVSLDNETRAVVLTGAGHGFCSGADQEDAGIIPHIDGLTVPTIALRAMELLDDVIRAVRRMHQPVIAAVNGAAIGGGFCLSLAADIRVASEAAYFRAAGINNGLTSTELGLSFLLPRAIGSSRAFEIMLTGRDIDAAEADRIGLVSRVVPGDQLLDAAYEVADRIASFSRPGIELTKRLMWSSFEAGSLQGHMDAEGQAQLFVRITTQNFEEGIRARKEKRPPVFKD